MKLFGTFRYIIYLNIISGSYLKQYSKILTKNKRPSIKKNVDTESANIKAVIVLSEIKSQSFNNPTLSNKKR